MNLPIVKYGHPTLRQKGARIEKITPVIEQLISDMFDTMRAAKGVGLAAQQVAQALQLCVLDVRGIEDRPSTLELAGRPADPAAYMPLVLINPELKPLGAAVAGPEGCLSFPELFADITRPEGLQVSALNAKGEPIQFRCGGLLAKAIQHEWDHLQGILFIDRMSIKSKDELKSELDALMAETREKLTRR